MKKTVEFGTHLFAAAALATISGSIVEKNPTTIRTADVGTASAFLIPYLDSLGVIERTFTTGTASTFTIANEVSIARSTTPREEVIGELRSWKSLPRNWDGEGSHVPNSASIEEAVSFVNALSVDNPLPEPMLHPSGRAGLYWNDGPLYADFEFTGENSLTYYVERAGEGKHKGAIVGMVKGVIPPVLAILLKT